MKIIYKYELNLTANEISMPSGAVILKAGEQNGFIVIWAMVKKELHVSNVIRHFSIIGTGYEIGNELADRLTHIDTVQMDGGLVWHVFEYEPMNN